MKRKIEYTGEEPVDIEAKTKDYYEKTLIPGSPGYRMGKAAADYVKEMQEQGKLPQKPLVFPEKPTAQEISQEVSKLEELRKQYMDEKMLQTVKQGGLKDKMIEEMEKHIRFSSKTDSIDVEKAIVRLQSVIEYYKLNL